MTEPASPILGYSPPPPPPPNELAGADPQWLGQLWWGCLVTVAAAALRGLLELKFPLYLIAGIDTPPLPAWVYLVVDALFAAGALFCNIPRPVAESAEAGAGDDAAEGWVRTLAMVGLLGVFAIHLFDLLSGSRSLIHPSEVMMVVAGYIAPVLGLVGMVAFMRVLGLRARQVGLDRLSARLRAAMLTFAAGYGATTALWVVPSVYRLTGSRFVWPLVIVRLTTPAHIATATGLGLLAWSSWTLSVAFRRTAAGRRDPGEA